MVAAEVALALVNGAFFKFKTLTNFTASSNFNKQVYVFYLEILSY